MTALKIAGALLVLFVIVRLAGGTMGESAAHTAGKVFGFVGVLALLVVLLQIMNLIGLLG